VCRCRTPVADGHRLHRPARRLPTHRRRLASAQGPSLSTGVQHQPGGQLRRRHVRSGLGSSRQGSLFGFPSMLPGLGSLASVTVLGMTPAAGALAGFPLVHSLIRRSLLRPGPDLPVLRRRVGHLLRPVLVRDAPQLPPQCRLAATSPLLEQPAPTQQAYCARRSTGPGRSAASTYATVGYGTGSSRAGSGDNPCEVP
jgi:hypothetical protein